MATDDDPFQLSSEQPVAPDSLFPSEGTWEHVQTAWTRTGPDYELGFEEAANVLVELASQRKLVAKDHVGLAIVFLERHRLELMLKNAIQSLTRKAAKGHGLAALWERFETEATREGFVTSEELAESRALVMTLDGVDPVGQAFRYPKDNTGRRHTPPDFIDLRLLHAAVNQVWRDVAGALTYLDELEGAAPDWSAEERWWRNQSPRTKAEPESPAQ